MGRCFSVTTSVTTSCLSLPQGGDGAIALRHIIDAAQTLCDTYAMSKPLDLLKPRDSVTMAVRFPRPLADRIDAEVHRLQSMAPESVFGRSDAVRMLVAKGLAQ